MDTYLITLIFLCSIVLIFCRLLYPTLRISKVSKVIKSALSTESPLESLKETKLKNLADVYQKSINIKINNEIKTNIPASEYISDFTVCKSYRINMRIIDAGAGILVGLGLLGTFGGLTFGINEFDSSNSDNIQSSIQSLLDGMDTAFMTSLWGMGLSLIFTGFEKWLRNGLSRRDHDLNQKLNDMFYVDDIELLSLNQEVIAKRVTKSITEELHAITIAFYDKIRVMMLYQNAEGHEVPIANAIREILVNNEEQTKALKSFSTDLALELNDRLDETLSRQMQQRLIPLMESVDATTKSVVDHIDQMALNVSSPATDMIEKVVEDLKSSLMNIMEEFKSTLSKNATDELENLALSLGSATKAIGEFPQNMANISDVLHQTITEVKKSIAEILNSSAAANSSAMKQMQEQIVFATNSISNAIIEVKDVMATITHISQQSSQELIEKMFKYSEEMSTFMKTTMEKVSRTLESSMISMSDEIANKQTDMLVLQEDSMNDMKKMITSLNEISCQTSQNVISQTEKLLALFNVSIERLNTTNTEVSGNMNIFQQAQSNITGTMAHLQTISGDMRNATELFRKGQSEYMSSLEKVQSETQTKLENVVSLFEEAGNVTDEYTAKFEIIRTGLGQIFNQIQVGLNEYSNSVRISIQKYLDGYTASLTQTTDALASTIQQQNEMVEMLIDTVNSNKR